MPYLKTLLLLLVAALAMASSPSAAVAQTSAPEPGSSRATPKPKLTSGQRAVKIARAELARGVRELPAGSNRSPRIHRYGSAVSGRAYPAPWCAYFASWVAKRAGAPIGRGGRGIGYAAGVRSWAASTGRWRARPRPGDIAVFASHAAVVESVKRGRRMTTIDGNYSNRVTRRHLSWGEAQGFARLPQHKRRSHARR